MIWKHCFIEKGDVDVGHGVTVPAGLSVEDGEDLRVIRSKLLHSRRVDLENVGKWARAALSYRQQTGHLARYLATRGSPLLGALTREGCLVGRGSGIERPIGAPVLGGSEGDARTVDPGVSVRFAWKVGCSNAAISNRDVLVFARNPEALVATWLRRLVSDALAGLGKAVFDSGEDGFGVEGLGRGTDGGDVPVGGIDPASRPVWRNRTGLIPADPESLTGAITDRIAEHLETLGAPHEQPDLIVMPPDLYWEFGNAAGVSTTDADGQVRHRGIRVVADPDCPRDRVHLLNTRYLGLVAHEAQNLAPVGGERRRANQNAVWLVLGWTGNLAVTSRRLQCVLQLEGRSTARPRVRHYFEFSRAGDAFTLSPPVLQREEPRAIPAGPHAEVHTQLDSMSAMQDGWWNGVGVAPQADGLDWLAEAFRRHYSADCARPRLRPTPGGGIRAEWSLGPWRLGWEIDLESRRGAWMAVHFDTGELEERPLRPDAPSDWDWLASRVRDLQATGG